MKKEAGEGNYTFVYVVYDIYDALNFYFDTCSIS